MTTIEEQIRRYAVDVAGPPVGDVPADLGAVGARHHIGRWILVAALALFIAGLGYVAAQTSDSSSPPVATTPETTAPLDPTFVAQRAGIGSCSEDGGSVGMRLEGSAADGLCVTAEPGTGDLANDVNLTVYSHGTRLLEVGLGECPPSTTWDSGRFAIPAADGSIVMIDPVAPTVDYVRLDNSSNPSARVEAFDLDALRQTRLAISRIDDVLVAAVMTPLDAAGVPQRYTITGGATACPTTTTGLSVTRLPAG
jgi:hypothetical protein